MPLARTYFFVALDDPDNPDQLVEHRVEIKGGDQMRAELEGRKLNLDHRAAIHQSYLWAWASLVRQDLYDRPFAEFRNVVVAVKPDTDSDDETVDPTRPAILAGSPSPSPLPTPEPPSTTGSPSSPPAPTTVTD